ncbi:hypothetical protein PCE1_003934 [Barthelona sp. PCE]
MNREHIAEWLDDIWRLVTNIVGYCRRFMDQDTLTDTSSAISSLRATQQKMLEAIPDDIKSASSPTQQYNRNDTVKKEIMTIFNILNRVIVRQICKKGQAAFADQAFISAVDDLHTLSQHPTFSQYVTLDTPTTKKSEIIQKLEFEESIDESVEEQYNIDVEDEDEDEDDVPRSLRSPVPSPYPEQVMCTSKLNETMMDSPIKQQESTNRLVFDIDPMSPYSQLVRKMLSPQKK